MTLSFFRYYSTHLLVFITIATTSPLSGTAYAASGNVLERPASTAGRQTVNTQSDFSYENATITEDITWSGSVLIRGYLLVAPQTTLSIAPGTVVRFMKPAVSSQTPRLVVMGRLQCSGTEEKPVLFTSNFAEAGKGDWRGILFLTSEKRNECNNCRIEGAEVAIEARYSTVTAKGLTINRSVTGLFLQDGTANVSAASIDGCETGVEAHDSELDLREARLAGNRRGIVAHRSGLVMTDVYVSGSELRGIMAEECGIKFNSCRFSENGVGALLKGGTGRIFLTHFTRNREVGLHLSGARVKVERGLFVDNIRDGLRMDDGRGLVWSSAFDGNGGYNLVNNGGEDISAVRNWWGSADETAIRAKLLDNARDSRKGAINISPWLAEKPLVIP